MTSLVLSVALILAPSPVTDHKEASTWQPVTFARSTPKTSGWSFPPLELIPSPVVETPPVVSAVSSAAPPATVTPPPTPIDVGLNRLAELGATAWQLRTFGCLAWFESKNNPYAVSRTNDYGIWQVNRYYHAWRWAGRDIFDPIVNAEVAFDIYRESGFRAWTTHGLCGV